MRHVLKIIAATGSGTASAAFSPLSLSPIVWYDPSDLTTLFQDSGATTPVTADGDVAGYVGDKSGNGFHLTQGTTANKLLYKTAGGLNWLLGDGVDDFLRRLNLYGSFALPATVAVAFKYDAVGADDIIDIGSGAGDITTRWVIGDRTSNFMMYAGGSVSAIAAAETTSAHVIIATFNNASSTADYDGVVTSETPGAGLPNAASDITLLSLNDGTAEYLNGRIYQVVIVNRQLTAGETSSLRTYLGAKAGLTL